MGHHTCKAHTTPADSEQEVDGVAYGEELHGTTCVKRIGMSVGQVYAVGHVCSEVSISIGVAYSYKGENHLDDEYRTHYDGNRPVGLYLWI